MFFNWLLARKFSEKNLHMCFSLRQTDRSNLMVDYYEGEEVSNRLVTDDEEEERDNVVAL